MSITKEELLEGVNYEDINDIIQRFVELNNIKKQYEKAAEDLKVKVKVFMKEKRWNDYKPDDNISVTITRIERQTIDKDKLKMLLTRQQLESISKFNTVEKILISTKEQRERMKRFINNGKSL
jgi:hypothetical protein